MASLICGNLVTERFGAMLHPTGINGDAGKFPQQLAAFQKTDHRTHCPNHAERGGRQAGLLDSRMPIVGAESAPTIGTMVVSPDFSPVVGKRPSSVA